MGAEVAGRDVDPLAVSLSNTELHPEVSEGAAAEAELLIAHLQILVGDMYAPPGTPMRRCGRRCIGSGCDG